MAEVKTDIEIANSIELKPIVEVAKTVGLEEDDLELYGKYKAKISHDAIQRLSKNKDGKLILVTAITPTPAGEGKSTCSIGLTMGLNKIGKKSVVALREPSLGPVLVSRAVLPAAVMHRLFRWKTSTCISPATCTP